MTGLELSEKYELTTENLLDYMRRGLQAREPRLQKAVLNRDELTGEAARVCTLIEMARTRGQDPTTMCSDPDRQEIYVGLLESHYVSFDLPAPGSKDDDDRRRSLIEEVNAFLFNEREFLQYHQQDKGDDRSHIPMAGQRIDALRAEIEKILVDLPADQRSAAHVMAELRKRAGHPDSCIKQAMGQGVQWQSAKGVKMLDPEALAARLNRMLKRP